MAKQARYISNTVVRVAFIKMGVQACALTLPVACSHVGPVLRLSGNRSHKYVTYIVGGCMGHINKIGIVGYCL